MRDGSFDLDLDSDILCSSLELAGCWWWCCDDVDVDRMCSADDGVADCCGRFLLLLLDFLSYSDEEEFRRSSVDGRRFGWVGLLAAVVLFAELLLFTSRGLLRPSRSASPFGDEGIIDFVPRAYLAVWQLLFLNSSDDWWCCWFSSVCLGAGAAGGFSRAGTCIYY